MGHKEQLQILEQGVEAWNAWWDQHRDISADLSDHAYRLGAHRLGPDLRGPVLYGADLYGAHLPYTNLRGAHLPYANLSRADLRGADLSDANLSDANLRGAGISGVFLADTVFGDTTLTAMRGLEACIHGGPSILDHRTLAQSWPLPLAFLRGCGLNDWEIEATKLYQPGLPPTQISDIVYRIYDLRADPLIHFYSCFISYASKDYAFAERLYADLQNKGVRCWFAPKDMKIGDRLRPRIDETIRLYDKLLLILSKTSVASQWVEQEVETALARERKQGMPILFPVRIDNTVMAIETGWPAMIHRTRHIGDFRRWKTHGIYQQAFTRLLHDLKADGRQPHG